MNTPDNTAPDNADALPGRTYFFSDTYGGHRKWDPLSQPDLDVQITTDLRGRYMYPSHRELDIWGQEDIVSHYLRMIVHLHDELDGRKDISDKRKKAARELKTGVFLNSAPRDKQQNGEPFYLATLKGGSIRVVATPLSFLSAIKNKVETLQYLPNPGPHDPHNGLYDHTQQFRSSLTPILLDPQHGLNLIDAPISSIPDPRKDWHVAFVDRFGNIITHTETPEDQFAQLERIATRVDDHRRQVELVTRTGSRTEKSPKLTLARSLGAAPAGENLIYLNGNIDIARKFGPGETADQKLQKSAYGQMEGIRIGTSLSAAQ